MLKDYCELIKRKTVNNRRTVSRMKLVVRLYQIYLELYRLFKIEKQAGLSASDSIRLIITRIRIRLRSRAPKENTVEVLGHTMHIDQNDSLNLKWNRVYEPYETEIMKTIIKPGDTVVDLGAFIGYYTLLFAKIVGQNGKVIAFEPSPYNSEILKKNIQANNYSNVIVEEKAVADTDGKVTLYLCNDNQGMNRIYRSAFCDQPIEVECLTLDTYFTKWKRRIDFIKMDVEGSEYGVLKGMRNTLLKNQDIKLILEFNPPSIREYGKKPEEIVTLLGSLGFNIYCLNRRTKSRELVDSGSPHLIETAAVNTTTNILCTRTVQGSI